jgi:hypothetical protein
MKDRSGSTVFSGICRMDPMASITVCLPLEQKIIQRETYNRRDSQIINQL